MLNKRIPTIALKNQLMATERKDEMGRRSFLLAAGTIAATPLLGGVATQAFAAAGGGAESFRLRDGNEGRHSVEFIRHWSKRGR